MTVADMSAATDCSCACPTPVIVETPGSPGEPGEPGAAGTNGINAFSITGSPITLPAASGPVLLQTAVNSSAWMAIGQHVFASDGTNKGSFTVLSKPDTTHVFLNWENLNGDSLGTSIIASGATISPDGRQLFTPVSIAEGGTGTITATFARQALGVGGDSLTVYAAGTAYQLTATPALLNFGTTDPSLVLTSPGVWLILARARIDYTGATFAAVRTGTLKLRRTNNTAADIGDSPGSFLTDIITTLTYTLAIVDLQPIIYTTTNSNDIIQLWGSISVVPTAGSLDASEASIVAIRLFDQTV